MSYVLDLQAMIPVRDDCNCFSLISSHFVN
jgi:hypothetical protein